MTLSGKDPSGLAAGSIYLVANAYGFRLTQRDIAKQANITEVTLRNRAKQIEHYVGMLKIQ
jgi:transcription initiation factor TFIIB